MSENWFETLKNNPQEILDWCDREIEEYQKLKEIITKKKNSFFVRVELSKDEAYKIIELLKDVDEKLARKFGYKAIK